METKTTITLIAMAIVLIAVIVTVIILYARPPLAVACMENISPKCTILLTCTVNVGSQVGNLYQKNKKDRLGVYLKSIRRWLNETALTVVVVENSGYTFPELKHERKKFCRRLEIITFLEGNHTHAAYLSTATSKGWHEFYAINMAMRYSCVLRKSDFIVKVTGRYFVPGLEAILRSKPQNIKALRQSNPQRCEIVGASIVEFGKVFYYRTMKDIVEFEWEERILAYDSKDVLTLPELTIPSTPQGGTLDTVISL